jgi:nicotinate-nucleotide adenylyltransferase
MTAPQRIGLLGGSFDPVHYGHLIMAENAMEQLELDQVVFAPARNPPHKLDRRLASAEHRLAMVDLAIEERPGFVTSRIDLEAPGPSFTWELLERAHREWAPTLIYFILGTDSLIELDTWREPARILHLARIAAIRRPGFEIRPEELQDVPSLDRSVDFVDAPLSDVSSTELRRRVSAGRSVRFLVPETVRIYIERHSLYRD